MPDNRNKDIFSQDKVFLWITAATALILSIPLAAMQFINEMNWGVADFLIMGVLLFGTGSTFILVARKIPNKTHRMILGIAFTLALLYIWAELAVGVFTNLGS